MLNSTTAHCLFDQYSNASCVKGTLSFTVDASDLISVDEDGDVYLYAPSLRLSEYGMAYSFKTPIPNPASWFRGKSEPTEEVQEDNNPTEASDNNNLEMVINASVAGKLQQGKQKFVFEYEDGTQETREVYISSSPATISRPALT